MPDSRQARSRASAALAALAAQREVLGEPAGDVPAGADQVRRSCLDAVLRGLDRGVEPAPEALRVAVRHLLDALAAAAPGNAVEVRVPPYAAVQCVGGPRHTRGTPSNVIEMDAGTWLELAHGKLSWADALSSGRVHASGERADVSAFLPLL